MLDAIQTRTSRRSFEKQNLSKDEILEIQSYIEELNNKSGLTIELIEDGTASFSDLRKSYGLFTNVHSLILMKGEKEDLNLKEKVGYYGEDLILRVTNLNLGTCWVGATFDKDKFKIEGDESLICVIVVGKIKEMSLKEKMIRNVISKKKKTVKERLITDTDKLPDWLMKGMESVLLAPSAKNSQKVTFEFTNGKLYAKVPNDYDFDLVDLGIAKKHFEIAAMGKFELGNGHSFHLT